MNILNQVSELVNFSTLERGREYFEKNCIQKASAKYNNKEMKIDAIINGSKGKEYKTTIILDIISQSLVDTSCTCPAHGKYDYACKHVVALAHMIDYSSQFNDFDSVRLKETKKIFSDSLNNLFKKENIITENTNENIENIEVEKKLVRLELEVEGIDFYRLNTPYPFYTYDNKILRIKAGFKDSRSYYMSKIVDFVKSIIENKQYDFKNFHYDENYHYFSESDLKIIQTIYDYSTSLEKFGIKLSDIQESTRGIYLSLPLYEKLLYTVDETVKFSNDYSKSQFSFKYEPIFYMKEDKIKLKNIQKIDEDSLFYIRLDGNRTIYKLSNEENNILNQLKFIENFDTLSPEENKKFITLLEKKQIPISYYKDELGKVNIYFEKDDTKDNIIITFNTEDDARLIDGHYYYFKENMNLLKKIKKFFSLNLKKYSKETHFRIFTDYETFILFSEFLNNNFKEDELNIKMDKDIQKPRNISVNFNITNKENNLLDFNFSIDGIDINEEAAILNEIKKGKKIIKLSTGELVKIANKNSEELLGVIDSISNLKSGSNKITKLKALQLSQISKDVYEKLDEIEEFKTLFKQIKKRKEEEPKNLKVTLFPYQKVGFNWLKKMYELKFGAILADDMGLGKTLQIIALISSIIDQNKDFKGLIVVPTSLLHNWKHEFEKFSSITPILVEGLAETREKIITSFKNGILITTYQTLRNDIKKYKHINFDIAVLDEAQNIKNVTTQVKKAVMEINSEVNFALTGTPIENNILELWSIFDFIQNGYLDNITKFKRTYKEVLEDLTSSKVLNLRKIISPFILRRTKKEVLKDLPDKIENNMFVQLSNEQKKLYASYVQIAKKEMESLNSDENNRIIILSILTKLRQICNSPSLFDETYNGEVAKLEILKDLIPEIIENGHRFLIFSQFVGTLKEIENELTKQKIDYFYIDGSTNSKERMEISTKFNKGEKQGVLISLKAGGTGLNLIGADVVIHYDPWWNVAVENQASDRAYRIGQKNSVQVIKLVTEGTIEEKIIKIQENKKILSKNLLEDNQGDKKLFEMSDKELMDLITL